MKIILSHQIKKSLLSIRLCDINRSLYTHQINLNETIEHSIICVGLLTTKKKNRNSCDTAEFRRKIKIVTHFDKLVCAVIGDQL